MQDNHSRHQHTGEFSDRCPDPCGHHSQPTNRAARRGNMTRRTNPDLNIRTGGRSRRRAR